MLTLRHIQAAVILSLVVCCPRHRTVAMTIKETSQLFGPVASEKSQDEHEAEWQTETDDRERIGEESRGERHGTGVCRFINSINEFFCNINRLLATNVSPKSVNKSHKKTTMKQRTRFPRYFFSNDATRLRLLGRLHDELTSLGESRRADLRSGPGLQRRPFHRAGPFSEKDFSMLARKTTGRRKDSRHTEMNPEKNNPKNSEPREPTYKVAVDDKSRKFVVPPLKDIALVLNNGVRSFRSDPIVFSPGMNVNSALTQAAILFDSDVNTDANPFECDITRSKSLSCYVIKECTQTMVDQWHRWSIEVTNAFGKVVSRGVCLPPESLIPGYSVSISYISTSDL